MADEKAVEHESVRAAWAACRILDPGSSEEERRSVRHQVQLATAVHGTHELARGTILLIDLLVRRLAAAPDDAEAEHEEHFDPLSGLIPPLVRQLSKLELADPAHVPMVVGVLTAAAIGLDAVAWRDRFGEIPPAEALHLHFALWILADLYDTVLDGPGAADSVIRAALDDTGGASG